MSRKDFVAVAAEFKSMFAELVHLRSDADRVIAEATLRDAAHGMARVFFNANPRFDRSLFLAACGIK